MEPKEFVKLFAELLSPLAGKVEALTAKVDAVNARKSAAPETGFNALPMFRRQDARIKQDTAREKADLSDYYGGLAANALKSDVTGWNGLAVFRKYNQGLRG